MGYKASYDYNLLDELGKDVIEKNEKLRSLFFDLMKIIEDLNDSWDGFDCSIFQYISMTYLNNLLGVNSDIEFIGKYMRLASSVYSQSDTEFGKTIKKIGEDYHDRKEKYNS